MRISKLPIRHRRNAQSRLIKPVPVGMLKIRDFFKGKRMHNITSGAMFLGLQILYSSVCENHDTALHL